MKSHETRSAGPRIPAPSCARTYCDPIDGKHQGLDSDSGRALAEARAAKYMARNIVARHL